MPASLEDWEPGAPRAELMPEFARVSEGGREAHGGLRIAMDARAGLHGFWRRAYPVEGGRHYRFRAWRRGESVAEPRRCVVARVLWRDERGAPVVWDGPVVERYLPLWGDAPAEAEHPIDVGIDAAGWVEVAGTYRAPSGATRAVVELGLQWAPGGCVEWSEISLEPCEPPGPRPVRLAAVHLIPSSGESALANCRLYAEPLREAADRGADLVVLGECVNAVGMSGGLAEHGEPIPGPCSEWFAAMASRLGLHIAVGLMERSGHLVHNTAALLGPEGTVLGGYRKVCLPRDEIAAGIAPGSEYPAFETRFGRVGMMVCYDGFFPEVAGSLARNGAEVIAWPVWGCNPDVVPARALDNQVYLVSSTYEPPANNWMRTAVWDRTGAPIVHASEWGEVIVAEVDLAAPTMWRCLGNLRDELPRHRP